jgi:hypothetical protein
MPTDVSVLLDSSFSSVQFGTHQEQDYSREADFSEDLMPSVPPAQSTTYLDFMGQRVRRYGIRILSPDQQTFDDLEALMPPEGYAGYTLTTPQGSWTAVLVRLQWSRRWIDEPFEGAAQFLLLDDAAVAASTPAPIAGFVWSDTGLLVELDANQGGTWSADGTIDEVNIEWGDGDTSTLTGPFGIGGIPSAFHTYALAGDYVVTISVESRGQTSADESQLVTVA